MKAEKKLKSPTEKIQETKYVEDRNKNLIRQATQEIYNKGNYSHIDEIVSSDFVIHSLNPNKEIHGPEGAKKNLLSLCVLHFPTFNLRS